MANRETRELGGGGIAVYPKVLVSWVFTPVSGECGVMVERGCHFLKDNPLL
jgi:predicted N-acyltransferase